MASDSVVSGIVSSLGHRKILLELSSKLNLDNDPRLRVALRADEERIAAFIVSILDSKSVQDDVVLKLESDSAQCFIDVVQDALNRGFLMAPDHSRHARRIIRKLSESCDSLPSSLFITGVTGREDHPTFAGGFGDIYRATYGNKTVALKHMRHFIQSAEIRDIRLKLCREALVWKDLRHPHILTFIGIDRESFPSSLCMVSPWMEHGTILNYLKDHGRANVKKLLYEVAQGLQYLHSRNIVHGDLRGANILINEDWSACLADFGLSVFANATTTLHTSSRAGSLYWMAPELIDPDRFGYKFARTKASDVYAFGCVCLELYTGKPPYSELSQAAALLRVVNGERPERPSGSPAISHVMWKRINTYWAENPIARPTADVVVQEMIWPPLQLQPQPSRPLPPVPVARAPPPVSPSEPPSSPPVYVSPQGSPPGYDAAEYQRVELTPFKLAQMEKARQQGPSRELDLGHIMKLIGKASQRSLQDQTVLVPDMKTIFEKARRRDSAKLEALAQQLAEYSAAGRIHGQDAVFHGTKTENPGTDPDEILTLPEFVKEAPPLHVLNDPCPITPPLPNRMHQRRPSLPWLRISPSLNSLRYQLLNPKSSASILESATPVGKSGVNGSLKPPSPTHHRARTTSGKIHVRGQSDGEIKTPVRERVKDILNVASPSGSNAALWGLWRWVKPPIIDTEDTKSNSSFCIGRLSECSDDDDEIPADPFDTDIDPASDEPGTQSPPVGDTLLPDINQRISGQKPSDQNTPHHIPPDEDMWLLFECKIGAGNAYLLSEALAMTPLNKPLLKEFHQKCLESQEVISAQIPWASASADRSRVAKNQEQNENILTDNKGLETSMLTWEEELLSEILAANERLLSALRLYDDLGRLAVEPDVERRQTITEEAEEATASPDTSGNDRSSRPHTQAVVAAPAFPTLPATDPPPTTPHGLGTLEDIPVGHSYPFKVKALKAFTADPDDPDEISFIQGEILDILDKQGKWWLIQNEEGSVGIASSDYFSVFDGGDLQTETRRSSAGEPVYPYSTAENGKSFSEEEIFDVVEEQIQWWQATKPSGSTSGLSSNYSIVSWSEPQTFQHKAQALYNYTADRNDPREISFCQGEILDIGDKRADWWQARNTKGLVGIAPSNYLQLL